MQVVAGDFNLHYKKWYGQARMPNSAPKRKRQAEAAIDIMARYGLDLTLPQGMITRPEANERQVAGTIIDLS